MDLDLLENRPLNFVKSKFKREEFFKSFLKIKMILLLSLLIFPPAYGLLIRDHQTALPCSTNITTAWVDIALLFDVSSNMGNTNLRQLGLSLSSELSRYTFGTYDQPHTTRVGIITYASNATVLGKFKTFSNFSQVSSVLMSLKATNDNSSAGIDKALKQAENWIWNEEESDDNSFREPVIIIFGASLNGANIPKLRNLSDDLAARNLITVNFNPSDKVLTQVFNEIPAPSYNFTKSSSLYNDLNWAILQSNCFCGCAQVVANDSKTHRLQKYGDCYLLTEWLGINQNQTVFQMCDAGYNFAVTSQLKSNSIQNDDYFQGITDLWTGLHRNKQGKWVWYDLDGSEFPLGNYSNWAPGYNESSPGECMYIERDVEGDPFFWFPDTCELDRTALFDVACQFEACDASSGWPNCGVELMKKEKFDRNKKYRRVVNNGLMYFKEV